MIASFSVVVSFGSTAKLFLQLKWADRLWNLAPFLCIVDQRKNSLQLFFDEHIQHFEYVECVC